jgi:hypothetical protein
MVCLTERVVREVPLIDVAAITCASQHALWKQARSVAPGPEKRRRFRASELSMMDGRQMPNHNLDERDVFQTNIIHEHD